MRIIVFGAHPDDCEFSAGGTAVKWVAAGHRVKFVSVTNGDAGHQTLGGGELARVRRAETLRADKLLGVDTEIYDNHDGELLPTLEVRKQLIREIRKWDADVVVTHRPSDYHPDHRNTGLAVQDTAYMVIVPNVCPDVPPRKKNPVYLYLQDAFTSPQPFRPDVIVPIDDVWERKVTALHEISSQFYEWLPWAEGILDRVPKGDGERRRWLDRLLRDWLRNPFPEETAKRFGGRKVETAESFQVCEYGSRPTPEELKRIFPFA